MAYGHDWTEEITNIVCHASYTDALPSGGTDWFTRIREGASDFAYISLVGEVTTNGVWQGVDMHKSDAKNERAKMELVGDHVWRYQYYIPTNCIGERVRFHFEGVKYVTNGTPFAYATVTNIWYANSTNVPYIPYTMRAYSTGVVTNEAIVELDGTGTHLQIEFNDEMESFSLSRSTYQNFNAWTDAMDGYRGNYTSTSGVSDVKQRWDADIDGWKPTDYFAKSAWRESFNLTVDQEGDYPCYARGAHVTPNGWNVENGMFVPRNRAGNGRSIQLEGRGKGALMLSNLVDDDVPKGVGTVNFMARVSQVPEFDDFATYSKAGWLPTYAISAKVTMSRILDANRNPRDVSPANPSVSLVGYYQGTRDGCYEFRVTRSGQDALTVALYRWYLEKEYLLVSNILRRASAATLTGNQQSYFGVGGKINTNAGAAISAFDNMLVPSSNGDDTGDKWTCMCFSLYTAPSGSIRLDGYLSKARNTNTLSADNNNVLRVVAYEASGTDASGAAVLDEGIWGVGSVGCRAGFGRLHKHAFVNESDASQGIELTGGDTSVSFAKWNYMPERWGLLTDTLYSGSGFTAVIPSDQTIKLLLAENGGSAGWVESGWETNIVSFATNIFSFAPCVSPDSLVRLQTGESDAEIVIDEVTVNSWRAQDITDLSLKSDEWVYTMASIETSADIDGSYDLKPAGTNGYAFIFKEPGMVKFTPQFDIEIDRVLLVGGGGAGGWTIGGGGGGGGVLEYNESSWGNKPLKVKAGTPIWINVGAGGSAYANQTTWRTGGSGGDSSISSFKDASNTTRSFTAAKGGGGGGCWNNDNNNANIRRAGKAGGSGGGSANTDGTSAAGTGGQGYAGGRANSESPGGGGGAGGAGGAGVATSDGKTVGGSNQKNPRTGYASDGKAGKGGDGKRSDITGEWVYYGGGGGGGAGNSCYEEGAGGLGGGGRGGHGGGANVGQFTSTGTTKRGEDGTDGLGGGGGGGGFTPAMAGGDGGNGCVILRVRTASKLCVLQPTKSYPVEGPQYKNAYYPMGLRSKFLEHGLSLFSFSYMNADSNAVVSLQICTNIQYASEAYTATRQSKYDEENWTTLTNWSFKSATDLDVGTRTYFLSLREPQVGMMRLIVDPGVITNALAQPIATRDLDYGKIMVTRIFCYDEPRLDGRSWWGWNLHTRGWNTDAADSTMRWAYLTDSPDGLSCSLNFSALENDNKTTDPDTYKIGLGDMANKEEYKQNNPFVQCPEMTNGIGSVSFRARTFETNATAASVVILYGAGDIGADQNQTDAIDGQGWQRLGEFVITNSTYETYSWKTTDRSLASSLRTIRLEVGGARNGRYPSFADWERPAYEPSTPIQRVFLDEVSVAEPVGPRLRFVDVRPFRSNLDGSATLVITNINSRDEQPLLDESWGIQARIEPQQMSDELDLNSIRVKMAAYVGTDKWGYKEWMPVSVDNSTRYEAELTCVDRENLIFRSTVDNSRSIIMPSSSMQGLSYAVVQYHVWAEYQPKNAPEGQPPATNNLSATEWVRPEWYWPVNLNQQYGSDLDEKFSAYTILDAISPGRAWLNEVEYNTRGGTRNDNDTYQFVEMVVPENLSLRDWSLRLTSVLGGNTLNQGEMARFGAAQPLTSKAGNQEGIDSLNKFTVVTFIPSAAKSLFSSQQYDAIWNQNLDDTAMDLNDGCLKPGNIYGFELVRPSGVVEHQIITSGTNNYAGTALESIYDVDKKVAEIRKKVGPGNWFYAGEELGVGNPTLGVWRGHGEELWEGSSTWTNDMTATPGQFNLRNGQRQQIEEDWLKPPNGTNVWVYAKLDGDHLLQYVDGNPAHATNTTVMMVVRGGTSTNILYKVDAWYELDKDKCTTNGHPANPGIYDVASNTFKIDLTNVTKTITVVAKARGDRRLEEMWNLAEDDPYRPAILDWLLRRWPDKGPNDIHLAEHWDLNGTPSGTLDLKTMYWLDIPPVEPGWKFIYAFKDQKYFDTEVDGVEYNHNAIVSVKMMITNASENGSALYGPAHPPYTIQGIEPRSSSAESYASGTISVWTSATFKVKGRLSAEATYRPVRWFVFDEHSFNPDGITYIEIPDQSSPETPGYTYGWWHFPGTAFLFTTSIDEAPSGLHPTELLRAVHTNSYHGAIPPQ